jgi:hypothetical protein
MAFETSKLKHVGGVPRVVWDRLPMNTASTKLMIETLGAHQPAGEARRDTLHRPTGLAARRFRGHRSNSIRLAIAHNVYQCGFDGIESF